MNIVDAMRSGRPFRRRSWEESEGFIIVDEFDCFAYETKFNKAQQHEDYYISPSDIMAHDWEIRQVEYLL